MALTVLVQKKILNPALVRALAIGVPIPGLALLETVGRISGQLRYTPVTNGLNGDTFWVVAERGTSADYVRNIGCNPAVRINVYGKWRRGTAKIIDEDPAERLRQLPSRINSRIVQALANDPIVVRVDLATPGPEYRLGNSGNRSAIKRS